MRVRPILFKPEMVRALRAGTKTQTRRIVKCAPFIRTWHIDGRESADWFGRDEFGRLVQSLRCPYGVPGDKLWVRETWAEAGDERGTSVVVYRAGGSIPVARDSTDGPDYLIHDWATEETPRVDAWRPSIFMPRWASRIELEITGVRIERLKSISEEDSQSEGATWAPCGAPQEGSHKAGFAYLWERVNGPGAWDGNPFVWVVNFQFCERPNG